MISPRKEFETSCSWPKPQVLKVIQNKISIPNEIGRVIVIRKNKHFADVSSLNETIQNPNFSAGNLDTNNLNKVYDISRSDLSHLILPSRPEIDDTKSFLDDIQIDPDDILSSEWKQKFASLCQEYQAIITPVPGKYNGYYGHVDNSLHFSSTPAPIKARLPNYSYDKMLLQAREMDKMEKYGVLVKPETIGVVPLHVVPSMLVPKPEPGEYRVVSDFNSLNVHIKKPEVILQTIEATKQVLAEFDFHAELDLSNYYWQGGMLREDSRYLATPHPFGGLRIYTVEPQGIKGAAEHGSERLARIFGQMEREKKTVRHADGIYVLGNSVQEVHDNLAEVFERAKLSGLTFKPKKIVICPKTTQLFGWRKEGTSWQPTNHVLSPLASADHPTTIKKLRGWLGAFKQVTACIKDYAFMIGPLESATGGKSSQEKVRWTPEMLKSFSRAKESLKGVKPVHCPKPTDFLELFPDYSEEKNAIGGWMKIIRPATQDKPEQTLLGGHFSQRLAPRKKKLIPCEGEALACRCLINHFRNYLRENKNTTTVFSDNLPVCQAWRKMKTGVWSKSSKVAALLTNMSIYSLEFNHFPGIKQKYGDYNSRNPLKCNIPKCQICQYAFNLPELEVPNLFIAKVSTLPETGLSCDVAQVTVEEIETGKVKIPFTEKFGWLKIQKEDRLHRELRKLILSGQTPEKKRTNFHFTQLKRMYNLYRVGLLKIDNGGLIIIRHVDLKGDEFDAVSVPEEMYPGLITALHIKLYHPSRQQLQRLASRYFFCLNSAKTVDQINSNCHVCVSLSNLPKLIEKQSTTVSGAFGTRFSADICKQQKQLIFICRENLSGFTTSKILDDETADSIREAVLACVLDVIPESGTVIRLDSAPAHQTLEKETEIPTGQIESLECDTILSRFGIKVDLGRVHNPNKNPVAENAVREFLKERLRLKKEGGPITEVERCLIMRNINNRIKNRGLAPKEILLRRDLISNEPKDIDDEKLSEIQNEKRLNDHEVNERCKATYLKEPNSPVIKVGDQVFIRNDLTKLRGREQYKVVELKNEDDIDWAVLQKSDSQLRSKRYKLKLTEIILVPFGSNTIKDIPQIIFSQEIDPIRGFTDLPEEKSKRHQVSLSIPHQDNQRQARAKLIEDLEGEIKRERKRGRPPKSKYPDTDVQVSDDFLDYIPFSRTGIQDPSPGSVLKVKIENKLKTPLYGFDYESWVSLLDLEIWENKNKTPIVDDIGEETETSDEVDQQAYHEYYDCEDGQFGENNAMEDQLHNNNDTDEEDSDLTWQETVDLLDDMLLQYDNEGSRMEIEMKTGPADVDEEDATDSEVLISKPTSTNFLISPPQPQKRLISPSHQQQQLLISPSPHHQFHVTNPSPHQQLLISPSPQPQERLISQSHQTKQLLISPSPHQQLLLSTPPPHQQLLISTPPQGKLLISHPNPFVTTTNADGIEDEVDNNNSGEDVDDTKIASDHEEENDVQEIDFVLKQNRKPVLGDKILYFSKSRDSWEIVSVISDVIKRFIKHGWYVNFRYSNMEEDGSYLHPGKPYWGLISEEEALELNTDILIPTLGAKNANDDEVLESNIGQVDGGVTPESLSPETSATPSPEQPLSPREARYLAREKWKSELETQGRVHRPRELKLRSSTVYATLEEYLDDNYSDQDSIFGDVAERHFYNRLDENAHLSLVNQDILTPTQPELSPSSPPYQLHPSSPWSRFPQLQPYEQIISGQVYRLPEVPVQTVLAFRATPRSSSPHQTCPAVTEEMSPAPRSGLINRVQGYFRRFHRLRIFKKT